MKGYVQSRFRYHGNEPRKRSIRVHLLFHKRYYRYPLILAAYFHRYESNMTTIRIVFCHVLLFGFALSSPVETKKKEKALIPEVITGTPLKVNGTKNISNEQVQTLSNAQVEKSSTKKRDVPRIFTDKNDYVDDDFYEGRATEDYDGNQPFRTYADNTPRIENSLFDAGKHRGDDYRYYDEESRRKRTATLDGIFNKADNNRDREIHLSPEDLMLLAAYKQLHHYSNFPYGRWNEVDNAIDVPEEEPETEEMYYRPENFFDGPENVFDRSENFFDRYYDQRYQNWAKLPRSDKFTNHPGKGFSGYPQLRVPLYKRAVL